MSLNWSHLPVESTFRAVHSLTNLKEWVNWVRFGDGKYFLRDVKNIYNHGENREGGEGITSRIKCLTKSLYFDGVMEWVRLRVRIRGNYSGNQPKGGCISPKPKPCVKDLCKECPNMNPSNSNSLLLLVGPILLKKTETLEKHLFNARFPSEYHNFGRAQLWDLTAV